MQRPGQPPPKLILWFGKLHSAGAGRCWYETQPPNIPARCDGHNARPRRGKRSRVRGDGSPNLPAGASMKQNIATLTRKLDKVFSEFIRLRDSKPYDFRYFKCISCGQIKPYEQMDCGHFVSRIHKATRWDEDNCNGECRACNRMSSDHIIYYQRNLEQKIGRDRVDMILARSRQVKKWSAWELETLIKHYEQEIEKLKCG